MNDVNKCEITHRDVQNYAEQVAHRIAQIPGRLTLKAYPIPRGGVPAAYAILSYFPYNGTGLILIDNPEEADLFIDDIIDSGKTRDRWEKKYKKHVFALIDKTSSHRDLGSKDSWIVWPWEGDQQGSVEDNITRLLQYVGEDPTREGLVETPRRVAKAWKEWCSGYLLKPEDILKTFEDGAGNYDEMVIQKDIPFYSHCEHHLAPFFGTVTIAYVPNGRIVGLSKLARLTNIFSRRLQVQERLTNQIANAIEENLKPKGVGVVIKARHLCIESRGVDKQGQYTVTSSLLGVLREKSEARMEFIELVK